MHIRSSLVFLVKISEEFPVWYGGGGIDLLEKIKQLEAKETDRADLQLMSRSLKAIFTKRSSEWLDESGKRVVVTKLKPKASSSAATSLRTTAKDGQESKPKTANRGKPSSETTSKSSGSISGGKSTLQSKMPTESKQKGPLGTSGDNKRKRVPMLTIAPRRRKS